METMKWSESISVGNNLIDEQHKKLFKLTNNLILNSNAYVNSAIIAETLNDLLAYIRTHFKDEEVLMKKYNYPQIIEHKKEHDDFIYKVAMFCKDVIDNKATVTEEMLSFLVNWLYFHISKVDQNYKIYL